MARGSLGTPIGAAGNYLDVINVKTVGAAGDGVIDDWEALTAATALALSEHKPLYVPYGTYKITQVLDWKQSNLRVIGGGMGTSGAKIRQHTDSIACVKIGGDYQHIDGLCFTYNSAQYSNTGANTVELRDVFMSRYSNIRAELGRNTVHQPQEDASGAGNNTVFSSLFENWQVIGYGLTGIRLQGYVANNTGNVWNNTYVQNNYSGSNRSAADGAVLIADSDETVFNQLNIEWCDQSDNEFLRCVRAGSTVINGLHFEGLTTLGGSSGGRGLIRVADDSVLTVNGMVVLNNTFTTTGSSCQSIARLGTDVNRIVINGLRMRNNTWTASKDAIFDYDSGSVDNFHVLNGAYVPAGTRLTNGDDPKVRDGNIQGAETMSRGEITSRTAVTCTNNVVRLGYFVPRETRRVTTLGIDVGTAAGATPTYGAIGLYTVAENGDLTLVAQTTNDTTLFDTLGKTERAISVGAWTLIEGRFYALGVLCMTGASAPVIAGSSVGNADINALDPRLCATTGGSGSALPSSVVAASISDTTARPFIYAR